MRVFGSFFGRPDGFGSSHFAQNVDFLMLYLSIWVSGADSMKFIDLFSRGNVEIKRFLIENVSKFNDFFKKSSCSA